MRCIYCGTPLSGIDYCTGCGADITVLKRIVRISNLLYNEGLEKATVRDLSGAVACLKRSLKFNKENIDARNLLGLVYFESGEVVAALSEWVISKNFQPADNPANEYIEKLQANKNRLDTINLTIRKYNQSLIYCREDNEDMAIIQLKKVLTQNPKLIKGYQLLALLYLKRREYERARKLLKKAIRIDATNTTTLRYLREVELATGITTSLDVKHKKRYEKGSESKMPGTITYKNGNEVLIQPATFRESSTAATFFNIFLGLILGAAIIWFLAIPANTQNVHDQINQQVTDANTKLASETSKVQSLEDEIEQYQSQVDEVNAAREAADQKAQGYEALVQAADYLIQGDQASAASALEKVDQENLETAAQSLYTHVNDQVKSVLFQQYYVNGGNYIVSGDYDRAIEELTKAVQADPDQYDGYYMLGMAYYYKGDTENANKTFQNAIERFPDRASELQQYISGDMTGATIDTTGDQTGTDGTGTGDGTGTDGTGSSDPVVTDPTGVQYDQYGNIIG